MGMGPHSAWSRAVGALATLCLLLAALAAPAGAAAAARLHPAAAASPSEAARIAGHWTEARMLATPPLDAARGAGAGIAALASFANVSEPTVAPFAVNGRLFVRQGKSEGFCSATAIDSASRKLVLTAGHCVNSGPQPPRGAASGRTCSSSSPPTAAARRPSAPSSPTATRSSRRSSGSSSAIPTSTWGRS